MTALIETAEARAGRAVGRLRCVVLVAIGSAPARDFVLRRLGLLGEFDAIVVEKVLEAREVGRSLQGRSICIAASSLPDGTGTALLGELRAIGHRRGVLLTPGRDQFAVRAAVAAGVRSLLVMPQLRPSGAAGTPVRIAGTAASAADRDIARILSQRETEVLALVADGQTNREIGVTLGLSALTVKSHLARIGRKLNTGDRAEMVAMALRAGAID